MTSFSEAKTERSFPKIFSFMSVYSPTTPLETKNNPINLAESINTIDEAPNEKSKKPFQILYMCICALFIIAAVVFPLLIYFDNRKVILINENEYTHISSDSCAYAIESYTQAENRISLQGWFAERGVEISRRNCSVVLKDQNDGSCYQLTTKSVTENNAESYFNDGLDYKYAGFLTTAQISKLKTDTSYLIMFLFEKDDESMVLYETNQTITINE